MKSIFCQNEEGQIAPVYSISAGLDYPGIGPEHAYLASTGRASYVPVTDEEAVTAFEYLARTEGIICAIESAHALAHALLIFCRIVLVPRQLLHDLKNLVAYHVGGFGGVPGAEHVHGEPSGQGEQRPSDRKDQVLGHCRDVLAAVHFALSLLHVQSENNGFALLLGNLGRKLFFSQRLFFLINRSLLIFQIPKIRRHSVMHFVQVPPVRLHLEKHAL